MKTLASALSNRPGYVNAVLGVCVLAHLVVVEHWRLTFSVRHYMRQVEAGDASVFFLGAATVASMAAGFAGVVVIFALGNSSGRFRMLRRRGAERLRATWTSVVGIAFLAAALCLVAAFTRLADLPGWSWIFEYALLLLGHGTLRLLWLLRAIADIVRADDIGQTETSDEVPAQSVVVDHDDVA